MQRRAYSCVLALVIFTVVHFLWRAPSPPVETAESNGTEAFAISPDVAERMSEIQNELESLENHDWAGRYSSGDGLGSNLSLCVAPRSGAAYKAVGCLGLYDQDYGPVKVADRRLHVDWKLSTDRSESRPDEYLAIRWGLRRYLVPPSEIIDFCSAARVGREPRRGVHGMFLLRCGDERLPAQGEPIVPIGFSKYLYTSKIDAKVNGVGDLSVEELDGSDQAIVTQLMTLNVGAADGVLPGMKFKVTHPAYVAEKVVVLKVNERDSDAKMTFFQGKQQKRIPPTISWRLTTPSW